MASVDRPSKDRLHGGGLPPAGTCTHSVDGIIGLPTVKLTECGRPVAGQAFLDPHEQLIEYHIVPHGPYRRSLELGPVRIDTDEAGAPVFVEVDLARIETSRDLTIRSPHDFDLCRCRLEDQNGCPECPCLVVGDDKSLCHIVMAESRARKQVMFSEGSVWEIDANGRLAGLWLFDIEVDPSGLKRALWRATAWKEYRLNRLRSGVDSSRAAVSPISGISRFEG